MTRRMALLAVALAVLLAGCAGLPGGESTTDVDVAGTDAPTEAPDDGDAGTDDADDGTEDESDDGTEDGDGSDGVSTNDSDDGNDAVDGELEIHHINVGQADATLVVGPTGETMLVDTGNFYDDGAAVIDYLETAGIDRIDHLVATHNHADHIGGHAAIIRHFETERDGIGAAYDNGVPSTSNTYEDYLDAVEEHDVTLYETSEGDHVDFEDDVAVTVLNPPADAERDDHHQSAIAMRLEFGATSYLFTGDAETDAEERMLDEHAADLDADVFHAGHHGSDTSNTADFLDAVSPDVVTIQSDYDSQYGHPHEEPLERFAERGIDAYWTGTHGTVVLVSDGDSFDVATQHDAPVDPARLREGDEATADPTDDTEHRETYGPYEAGSLTGPAIAPSFGAAEPATTAGVGA